MQPLGVDDPTRIGDYRLLGLLGAGGMGRVYLGRNAGGRTVAVKVIRPDLLGDTQSRERFRREVNAARLVDGRYTAPVLDADVDAVPPWLATGYVAGFSLTDAVDRFGVFDEDTLLVLARGLVQALAAVHRAGLVHRDMKPSNVLLAVDGPKVIDFGIARALADTGLTTTGKVIGSPGFMCPEQVSGEPIGPAADIFAFGGVLVFAASGHGPFGTGDTMQMLWRVMYEEPLLDRVPDRLRPLVAACLDKVAENRPTTDQLLTRLAELDVPERGGWLPAPVLHEVSRRAVELLDLDSGPMTAPPFAAERQDHSRTAETLPRSVDRPGYATGPTRESPPHGLPPVGPRTGNGNAMDAPSWPPNHYPTPEQHRPQQFSSQPPEHTKRPAGQKIALVAGAVLVAVAVAVAAYVVGSRLTGNDAPRPTETSAATVSTVPKAFVGEWKGTARGLVAFDIVLTIRDGKVGDEVANSANTGKLSGARCERAERLTTATSTELAFIARLTGGSPDCQDDGSTSTAKLLPDGSLAYSTPGLLGDTISATLRKS